MENRWKILDTRWSGIKLKHKYETFVLIDGTKKFYISTLGQVAVRCRNGKYKVIGEMSDRCKIGFCGERKHQMVFIDALVANAFLVHVPGRDCIWHKDRNRYNNNYRNLIYVTKEDYIRLLKRKVKLNELNYIQYYFPIWAFNKRIQKQKYTDMIRRCAKKNYGYVCSRWLYDERAFYQWMEDACYLDTGSVHEIDKDILLPGNKVYSSKTCCFIPKKINLLFEKPKRYIKENKNGSCYFVKPGTTGTYIHAKSREEAKEKYIHYRGNLLRRKSVEYRSLVTENIYHAMLDYITALPILLA